MEQGCLYPVLSSLLFDEPGTRTGDGGGGGIQEHIERKEGRECLGHTNIRRQCPVREGGGGCQRGAGSHSHPVLVAPS